MPLKIVRQDITKMECDAIVNSTNPSMIGAGGADAAIHEVAGSKLDAACKRIGGVSCRRGAAYKGLQAALPLCHSYGRHSLEGWQTRRAGSARVMLS